jgi:hypothetical protein
MRNIRIPSIRLDKTNVDAPTINRALDNIISNVNTLANETSTAIDAIVLQQNPVDILAGSGIAVVESPTNTWTITNTAQGSVQNIAAGNGISVAQVGGTYTITNTLPEDTQIVAGNDISVVESPAGTFTIANTSPASSISIAAGNAGIGVTQVGNAYTISNLGVQTLTAGTNITLSNAAGNWTINSVATSPAVTIQAFGSQGSFSFSKPASIQNIRVLAHGAGGSGGSGGLANTGGTAYGGQGGGRGDFIDMTLPASAFPATITGFVGVGGNGVAGVSVVGNGNNGIAGSATFVNMLTGSVLAAGGKAGVGGASGLPTISSGRFVPYYPTTGDSVAQSPTTGTPASSFCFLGGNCGGAGGGVLAGVASAGGGCRMGGDDPTLRSITDRTATTFIAGGAAGGNIGNQGSWDWSFGYNTGGVNTGFGAASGGGAGAGVNGGGGAFGKYGSGGGGGGACAFTGGISGTGNFGGDGWIIIAMW